MRIEQSVGTFDGGWTRVGEPSLNGDATLVLAFGARHQLEKTEVVAELRTKYPRATIVGCSTAGEISGTNVLDGSTRRPRVARLSRAVGCDGWMTPPTLREVPNVVVRGLAAL